MFQDSVLTQPGNRYIYPLSSVYPQCSMSLKYFYLYVFAVVYAFDNIQNFRNPSFLLAPNAVVKAQNAARTGQFLGQRQTPNTAEHIQTEQQGTASEAEVSAEQNW